MNERNKLFFDYGELLFRYDFNKRTLSRAHALALQHLNSLDGRVFSLPELSLAHNKTIQRYLTARRKDNIEWTIEKIMESMLKELGANGQVDALDIADIYKMNDHDAYPKESTLESLPKLADIGELGIISNLPHDSLIYELRREGVFGFFSTITVSYQVGYRKPRPEIYYEALRRANASPEESTFISHDQKEVEGARCVGMHAFVADTLGEALTKLASTKNENSIHQH